MRIRLAAIVLIAGLLAACTSGNAQPTPSTSSDGSATTAQTSPSPTQTGPLTTGPNVRPGEKPPELPDIATHRTLAGAIAFGGYYFKALDWSVATNDAIAVQMISARSCNACRRVSAAIETLRENDETETGGRITVRSAVNVADSSSIKSDYVIRVVYDEQAVRLTDSGGDTHTTVRAAHNAASYVFIKWIRNVWRVVEVTEA